MPMMKLVEYYKEKRILRDSMKNELDIVDKEIDGAEFLLIATMESQDIKQLKTTDGCTISTVEKSYPRIVDKELCYSWLKTNQLYETLSTVNTMTFRAFVNERIKNGEEAPPGIETFNETKLSLRRK